MLVLLTTVGKLTKEAEGDWLFTRGGVSGHTENSRRHQWLYIANLLCSALVHNVGTYIYSIYMCKSYIKSVYNKSHMLPIYASPVLSLRCDIVEWASQTMAARMRTLYHGNLFSHWWPFVTGIHQSPLDSPHIGPVMQPFGVDRNKLMNQQLVIWDAITSYGNSNVTRK